MQPRYCRLSCGFSQILSCVGGEQRLKKPSFSQKLGFSCAPFLCVAELVEAPLCTLLLWC